MAFVIVFVLLLLAVPLAAEIQRHGRDNIVTKSATEFQELEAVKRFSATVRGAGIQTTAAASNVASLGFGLLLILFALSIAWTLFKLVLSALWSFFT